MYAVVKSQQKKVILVLIVPGKVSVTVWKFQLKRV